MPIHSPHRFPSLDMPRVVEGFHVSKSHAGARIYHQSWHPDPSVEGDPRGATAPLAAVVWAHGVHEHSGRFARVFEHLARAGVASHAWDHVGHGRSDACPTGIPHQFANGLDAVVEDAAQYFRSVRRMYPPEVPVMLAGVSMGGLVATLAALDGGIEPDGLLLVAPLIDVHLSPAMKAQAAVGSVLARLVPHARITPGVEPSRLSKDAEAVREYTEDPLVFVGNIRVKLGYELLRGFTGMRRRWGEVRVPLLVLHGTEDEATDPVASARFVEAAGSVDKRFVSLKGACHLICHEAGAARKVANEIKDFVVSRAKGAGEWAAEAQGGRGDRGVHANARAARSTSMGGSSSMVGGEHAYAMRAARL